MTCSRHYRSTGFTFIEIMFVVIIMTTLATLSFPRMKGSYLKTRINKAARDVVGALRMARNTAVIRELPCEVRFDVEKDEYRLVLLDEYFEEIEQRRKRTYRRKNSTYFASVETLSTRRLPSEVHFDTIYSSTDLTRDDEARVIYYPDGSATPTTISIRDESNLDISVEIYRTTGMARVEDGIKQPKDRKETKINRRSHNRNRW